MESSFEYETTSSAMNEEQAQALVGFMGITFLFYLAFIVFMLSAMWKVFTKANRRGWEAIIPIYNTIVMLEIVGRPVWWIALMLVPFVNVVVAVILMFDIAKAFGKGPGFGLILLLLPFIGFPMLAWGSAQYRGPAAAGSDTYGAGAAPGQQGYASATPTQPVYPQTPAQPQTFQSPAMGVPPQSPQGPAPVYPSNQVPPQAPSSVPEATQNTQPPSTPPQQ